jgi:8-oxo-dGTP pyrophosphatase MutT (NUDIX family)
MASEKLFYIGIKGLIENQSGKVLLLKADVTKHRKNTEPYWDIPGGRIDEGQSVLETLKREIEEETGIRDVEEQEFFYAVVSNHEIPVEDKMLGLALMIYKVKVPTDSKIKLSHEHTAYEWADKKEAAKRLTHKYPTEFTDLLTQDAH